MFGFEFCFSREFYWEEAKGAIIRDDILQLNHCIEENPWLLKELDEESNSLLHHAALYSANSFCFLAEKMPEYLTQPNSLGRVPAHLAARGSYGLNYNSIKALELIEKMAPETFGMKDVSGFTPAHDAALIAVESVNYEGYIYREAFDYIASKHPETLTIKDKNGDIPQDILSNAYRNLAIIESRKLDKDSKQAADGREL